MRCARVAEYSVGLMGRTPDYMNVTFAGFAGRSRRMGDARQRGRRRTLVAYQKFLRRDDLSLTHTIVQPTVDKARGDAPQAGNPCAAQGRPTPSTASSCGARASWPPLPRSPTRSRSIRRCRCPPGADAYALSFCIPMGTPGLKFLCRDSISASANRFDHPFSSRFDEQDAFVIFDDVEVPRDRLFIDGNLAAYNTVMATSWPPNIMQQTMIRASVKLEFAWGLATRMAAAINAADPETSACSARSGATPSSPARPSSPPRPRRANGRAGCGRPRPRPLRALRGTLPLWFPRVNEIMRLIGSHNLFATPTAAQMADKELRPLIDRYLPGPGMPAEERIRIFRLAWDFAGSALASRNEQYERFYLASSPRNLARHLVFTDRSRADRLVDRFLKEPL